MESIYGVLPPKGSEHKLRNASPLHHQFNVECSASRDDFCCNLGFNILGCFRAGFQKVWTFYVNLIVNPRNVHGKCSRQNVHSKPIVNPRTHREYPQEGGRLDAKRH